MSDQPTFEVWGHGRRVQGPMVATVQDIPALNAVFTEAFTDRYRRDGLVGVRVPPLSPPIWRYAIEDAGDGALCWRDAAGQIVAFNMVHHSGTEGWMGPLCVRPDHQGGGGGRRMVQAAMDWLRQQGVRVIGLETMPRTMENIGFYSSLGFVPGRLTVTLTLEAAATSATVVRFSQVELTARTATLAACRALTDAVMPGYDFTREIEITDRLRLGDTVLLGPPDAPTGFAVVHSVPLIEGRSRDELRVLKLVLGARTDLTELMRTLQQVAHQAGTQRLAVRVQVEYAEAYRTLLKLGARVRWTDLRMGIPPLHDHVPDTGMVLSNWEI